MSSALVSVRLTADMRRIAKRQAADAGITLATWLGTAVIEKAMRDMVVTAVDDPAAKNGRDLAAVDSPEAADEH